MLLNSAIKSLFGVLLFVPANFHFGGGASDSTMSPIIAAALIAVLVAVSFAPRKTAIVVLILGALLIPQGNVVVIGGVHLPCARVIAIFGIVRVARVGSLAKSLAGGFLDIDKVFLWWAFSRAISFVLLWRDSDALVNQSGFLISNIGMYLLLRHLIRDRSDIYSAIRTLAMVALVNSAAMIREQQTAQNPFGLIGGYLIPNIREGRVRSQGAFSHALLAGCCGATMLPLFLLLWKAQKPKLLAGGGILSSAIMTWTCATSTALSAYVGGLFGACLWPLRKNMRAVRWGIVLALAVTQIFMKAPVWFLINHLDLTGSSSSYHRTMLVDLFIRNVGDWWLLGTKSNADWGDEMWDTSNEFVSEGEAGGLLAFVLFISLISRSFRRLGIARKAVEGDHAEEWFFWLLGAALFSHILAFFGASYWDQSQVGWLALLAIICAATTTLEEPRKKRETRHVYFGEEANDPALATKDQSAVVCVGVSARG